MIYLWIYTKKKGRMLMWDVPVFQVETTIKISVEPVYFHLAMPKFISKLFNLGKILNHFAEKVEIYLSTSD